MSRWGSLFNPSGLTPHGFCLTWNPVLIWLHAGSDVLILLSYLSIPISLMWLLQRRHDRTYHLIGYLFVAFVLACATTHAMAIVTLWVPVYGLEALAKTVTAIASVATASTLWIMAPRLVAMPSPAQATSVNGDLSQTIAEQRRALQHLLEIERTLRDSNSVLERNVAKHAAELRISGSRLLQLFAERLATQKSLTKSEAEYRAGFEASTIGKVQMDPLSGRLLRVNGAFANIIGSEIKDIIGSAIWDFVHPDDRTAAVAAFGKLLAGEIVTWVVELRLVRRDGTSRWVRVFATVVIDPAIGLPRLAVAEIEDIDKRYHAQAALRATEARLRLALDSARFGIWEFDIRNSLVWADERCSVMTSGTMPANTWLSLTGPELAAWTRRVHPDDCDRRETQVRTLFAGNSKMEQIEYRALNADGGWSILSHRCAIVERDPTTGAPVRAVGIMMDMTERNAALIAMQASKLQLEQELEQHRTVLAHRHLLLREIYHRMDDALQSVGRLIAGQMPEQADYTAVAVLSAQRSRIHAMGRAHLELMAQVGVETFDIVPFLRDLCDAIQTDTAGNNINLGVYTDRLRLSLDAAIPLGLLVTELLTNCIRHTSSGGTGRMEVALRHSSDAEIRLILSDGGIGPADATEAAAFTAALQSRLVTDLMHQLGAELEACCSNGLAVEITMVHPRTNLVAGVA